jgi:DNA invertase Pin-like site-specific DNA recombinase
MLRVVLYLRRSTNELLQADSLDAQAEILRNYAATESALVVRVYADSASGRFSDGREDFKRLIHDVLGGADFDAVLVRDVSRWGRFQDVDESAYWDFFFFAHGVRVVYVQETFRDDRSPHANLLKSMKRYVAAEFSRDKARMVQFGKYRAAKNGFYVGGEPPYGMKRVLVDAAGRFVQALRRGDRKALNDHHIRLAPGKMSERRMVRRIFKMYAEEKVTVGAILKRLNAEHEPSPRGKRWRSRTIEQMLTNPAYIGAVSSNFTASQNFPTDQTVYVENCWPGIVSRKLWNEAQKTLEHRRWLRNPEGLAIQLREMFDKCGVINALKRNQRPGPRPTDATFRKYFEHGEDEAIQRAYAADLVELRTKVFGDLQDSFAIELLGETVRLNNSLRVGVAFAFPRGNRHGQVNYRFFFTGDEPQDVTIGVALSPSAEPAVFFLFVNVLFKNRNASFVRRMHSAATRTRQRSFDQIKRGLKSGLFRYSRLSRLRFLDAVKDLPLVNAQEVSRQLGWPESKGLTMYHRLKRDGVYLPPLKKTNGRRVTIVCDGCAKEQRVLVSNAIQSKSTLCWVCWKKSRERYRICVDCGDTRKLARGEYKHLSASPRCRRCANKFYGKARNKLTRGATGRFLSKPL